MGQIALFCFSLKGCLLGQMGMMQNASFDVCGIGNAIVDILAQTDDEFLRREDISKGTMTLIDAPRARALFEKIGTTTMVSGGSAANTIAGIAGLGGKGAYIGRVHADQLGQVFTHDMKALKVHYPTKASTEGAPTACCIILVTPDGQRSMNTFLGASTDLGAGDIDKDTIASSKVTYLEGYLFDKPPARAAFELAMRYAHEAGRKVALSLSDPFCVDRHRDAFRNLVKNGVDILFANEIEACSLMQTNTLDEALPQLGAACPLVVVTRSAEGALILQNGHTQSIAAEKGAQVVDTTGAGDLFAAGFLYGYTHAMDMQSSGRVAAICAAEVISHMGPRPQTNLRKLVESKIEALPA